MRRLAEYTHWIAGDFLRPDLVPQDPSFPTAEEAMFLWETHGKEPTGCSDSGTLQKYVQGKKSRDWHITEWRLGVSQKLFVPEEFFGVLGLRTAAEFKSIFGREVDSHLLSRQLHAISTEISAYESTISGCKSSGSESI